MKLLFGRILVSAFFVLGQSTFLDAQCPQAVWQDEFTGEDLDESKWDVQTGDGCSFGICGWGNNELQWYQKENAVVSGGFLSIRALQGPGGALRYTSARLRTLGKAEWKYGRFEARIRLPEGQGLWPAFWMLPSDNVYGPWPQSGEIDIMEARGQAPSVSYGTIHFGEPSPNNRSTGGTHLSQDRLTQDFHVYAIEWEDNEIRWYLDDVLFSRKTPDDLRGRNWPFDQQFHLILNLAVGGTFVGPVEESALPGSLVVDYVRVYDQSLPTLKAPLEAALHERGLVFQVHNVDDPNTSFDWTVPEDAQIVSGQGTSSIVVDWGASAGEVQVQLQNACFEKTLRAPIALRSDRIPVLVLRDFEENQKAKIEFASGSLDAEAANPDPAGVNPSPVVARYERSSAKFDVVTFNIPSLGDLDPFLEGDRSFHLDVFSTAPPGRRITLQLEASSTAQPSNFPSGRHSVYTAHTARQNEWERLKFSYDGRLDSTVQEGNVDQLILLIDPGWNTEDIWFFDNLSVSAAQDSSANLYFPYIESGEGHFTGIAVTNTLGQPVSLQFHGYNPFGQLRNLPANPTSLELAPELQQARLVPEIFEANPNSPIWIEMGARPSPSPSFFQFGNVELSRLGGGIAIQSRAHHHGFFSGRRPGWPEIPGSGSREPLIRGDS